MDAKNIWNIDLDRVWFASSSHHLLWWQLLSSDLSVLVCCHNLSWRPQTINPEFDFESSRSSKGHFFVFVLSHVFCEKTSTSKKQNNKNPPGKFDQTKSVSLSHPVRCPWAQVLTNLNSDLDQRISVPSFAINAKMVEATFADPASQQTRWRFSKSLYRSL